MLRTVHLLNEVEVMVPRPLPGSPLPDLSEPVRLDDVQDSVMPDVVSVSVAALAPVMAPPGLTVQVAVVAARDDVALRPTARAAAPPVKRSALKRLRIDQFLVIRERTETRL